MVLTEAQLQDIAARVRSIIRSESKGVGDLPIATSLTGIVSLPALRFNGGVAEVVEAPMALFTDAATAANNAKDTANTAASNANSKAAAADAAATSANSAAERTETAITNAESATTAATTASESANNAASRAQTVSSHPTKIGEDYYVYMYNAASGAYEKTTIYVKGADAITPTRGVDYWTASDQASILSACEEHIDNALSATNTLILGITAKI